MVYFPNQENNKDKNQEHVWISHELAGSFLKELIPENITLSGEDWLHGEVMATNSIHITNGFHASASDNFHAKIGSLNGYLIPENWEPDADSNFEQVCGATKGLFVNKNPENKRNISKTKKISVYTPILQSQTYQYQLIMILKLNILKYIIHSGNLYFQINIKIQKLI